MNRHIKVFIATGCLIIAFVSWFVAISSRTAEQKQLDLISEAALLISDEIYILAVPLLEEASSYDTKHTQQAEEMLKTTYLSLSHNRKYKRMYTALLDKQMNRQNVSAAVFSEAANYYLNDNALPDALNVLKQGIRRTGDSSLIQLYENVRYAYDISRATFDDVGVLYRQTLQVQTDDKWGIVNISGSPMIPCEYDKISTFHNDRAIVMKDNLIYAVDKNNNRLAVASDKIMDFKNYTDARTSLLTPEGWIRATGSFVLGRSAFEDIGSYSGNYVAAKLSGRWGVVDLNSDWLIPAEYDEIICDELGRCYGQGAVFVRNKGLVYLFSNGEWLSETYRDAHPFGSEGYAAVKKNDKWGFIDTAGNLIINYIYDDALSFGGHLAAVKKGECWGYISLSGNLVIDAVFLNAKSFSGGSAPVLTEKGWQIITLIEYKKEEKLL